jgi:predicted acylesterase/phospholipase RssA
MSENNVYIGTSMGAIIGCLVASGKPVVEIQNFILAEFERLEKET